MSMIVKRTFGHFGRHPLGGGTPDRDIAVGVSGSHTKIGPWTGPVACHAIASIAVSTQSIVEATSRSVSCDAA